jgi:hypothetical protein
MAYQKKRYQRVHKTPPDYVFSAIPPPPGPQPPSGGGGGGSGGSGGGGGGGSRGGSSGGRRSSPRGGTGKYPGVKVFGQPITRADFLRAKQHYDDLFRAWLGRPASRKEVERLLNQGISDYQLRINLMKRPNFVRSPMFKTLKTQAQGMLGFDYGNNKNLRNLFINAARSEGGLSEASLRAAIVNSPVAKRAVTKSFRAVSGADIDYVQGAFGGTGKTLTPAQYQKLALQQSGLQQSTLGARLQSQIEQATKRMQRVFEGTLAAPSLSMGEGGLQAPSLNPRQQPDLPA